MQEIIKDITIDELCSYLDRLPNDSIFLKIYNSKEKALSFLKGKLCLGTIEYYRNRYDGDGRGDKNDSKATHPIFVNWSYKNDPMHSTNEQILVTGCLTSLIFCLVRYDHSAKSKIKLKELLSQENGLGKFICVIRNKSDFIKSLEKLELIREIDEANLDKFIPKFKNKIKNLTHHDAVRYVERPDDSGFEKKNEQKYECQQEYRFCFDFVVDNMTPEQKGRLKGLFLYTINAPIECGIFNIIG